MSGQRAGVRSRRRPVVAVTGAASPIGLAVTAALHARVGTAGGVKQVIALDGVRGAVDGPLWRVGDTGGPQVADGLAGADAVVHVAAATDLEAALTQPAPDRRARAVRCVQAVATASAAVGARHLVAVTGAMVYGASPDNPVPLDDNAPLAALPDDGLVGDLLDVERVLARTPQVHPSLSVAVVRPAAVVGPGVDTVVTRHFEAPRLLVVRGSATLWQFCHLDDVAAAVVVAVLGRLEGSLTCGSPQPLSQEDVERISGMRRVEVRPGLAFSTAERLHRAGVLPMPAGDLAFVVHPWVVGSRRLLEAGWEPAHSNEDCLRALLAEVAGRHAVVGRRVDRRDAALGAAGAAVALVGTAAVLRQARARRARRSRHLP